MPGRGFALVCSGRQHHVIGGGAGHGVGGCILVMLLRWYSNNDRWRICVDPFS